jgi:hypothetical protein
VRAHGRTACAPHFTLHAPKSTVLGTDGPESPPPHPFSCSARPSLPRSYYAAAGFFAATANALCLAKALRQRMWDTSQHVRQGGLGERGGGKAPHKGAAPCVPCCCPNPMAHLHTHLPPLLHSALLPRLPFPPQLPRQLPDVGRLLASRLAAAGLGADLRGLAAAEPRRLEALTHKAYPFGGWAGGGGGAGRHWKRDAWEWGEG